MPIKFTQNESKLMTKVDVQHINQCHWQAWVRFNGLVSEFDNWVNTALKKCLLGYWHTYLVPNGKVKGANFQRGKYHLSAIKFLFHSDNIHMCLLIAIFKETPLTLLHVTYFSFMSHSLLWIIVLSFCHQRKLINWPSIKQNLAIRVTIWQDFFQYLNIYSI